MTIGEAIKHCEEKAEELRQEAKTWTNDGWQKAFIGLTPEKEAEFFEERQKEHDTCLECAKEHEQLAEWLKELKDLRIFAAFAAKSVCSDEFEEDSGFYAEVLCRKLTKLGYIELDGDTYKLKENSTCTEAIDELSNP